MVRLVSFKVQQLEQGVCPHRAAMRRPARPRSPICYDGLSHRIVKLNLYNLEASGNRIIWALAKARLFGATLMAIIDATNLRATAMQERGGQLTSRRKVADHHGHGPAIEVTIER